ncbi:amino acid adenylation domain-containing protein [Streptomyces sp. NPDC059037]|uniref:amino acid adenylation domain-containing protein n=1 Tax=Streptomyces sp. NPDC059037 TaxID=3346710 RepID=UPI0036A2D86C
MSDLHAPGTLPSRMSGATRPAPVRTLLEAFDAQADRTPTAPAAADDRTQVSYRNLQDTSAALSEVLHERGVAPGDPIAVCTSRRIPLLTALLAAWRCGAHYVPLDPTWPPARIDDFLADAAPRLLITDADTTGLPTPAGLAELRADEPPTVTTSTARLSSRTRLSGTAYLIYTSGTTGRPKGVPITHGALMQYLTWASHHYDTAGGTGTLVHSSIAADLTVTSLLLPLTTGQRVHLVPSDDPVDVARTLSEARDLSPLKVTPGGLKLLTKLLTGEQLGRAVRHLVVGGEQLTNHALSGLDVPGLTVTNEYGPTEATVGCTAYTFRCGTPVPDPVPIGRPVWNTTVELRTPDTNESIPPGGTGELVVNGPQVAAGYQDRPQESAARFSTDTRGEHAYRTGDLARIRPDGHLEMLGRIDDQLKIHGYRVEPAEIEAVLTGAPSITDAAVVATRPNTTGTPVLSAFLVPATTAQKDSVIEVARTLCERQLPFYARPDHLHVLDALPLQPSGKVDRHTLAQPPNPDPAPADRGGLPDHDEPVLGTLARLWTDILGEPPHSKEANFFSSGGDSLKAVLYASAVQRAGLRLTVHDVLHHRTLGRIAEVLTATQAADQATVTDGPVPLSALQTAVLTSRPIPGTWTLRYLAAAPHQNVDPIRLQQAYETVMRRHPALRSTFSFADSGGWSSRLAPFTTRGIHLLDLSGHQAGDHDKAVDRGLAEREGHLSLTGPLVDLVLIGGGGAPRIAWIVHHLVADLVSLQILTHDLWHAYDHPASHPAAADDGYVHWLKSAQHVPDLPTGPWLTDSPRTTASRLGPDVRDTLITARKESSRRPLALLASALLAAVAEVRPDLPAALCVELHGRDRAGHDLAATVGWLTSLHPVHAPRALLADPAALVGAVHTQLENTSPTSPATHGALAPLALNYLGELPEGALELPPIGASGPLFGLEVVCFTQPGALQIRWRACPSWMPDATVTRLAAAFARHAAALPPPGTGTATAHELAEITAAFGDEGP